MADFMTSGKSGVTIKNWSGTYSCQPELYFEPETIDDIRQVVNDARTKGRTVRVLGKVQSFSDIAMTSDYLISMKNFNEVVEVDKDKCQVKVQGGITVSELNEKLAENGLAFSSLSIHHNITVAGGCATGTHGSGVAAGNMSSYVVAIELLTASGDVLEISENKNQDLLPAVRLSLGCLGVILTVTLQCEPAFNLVCRNYPCKLQDLLENLDVHVTASDHFVFSWVPYTEYTVCSHVSRTDKAPTADKPSFFWHVFVGGILFEFLLWLSSFFTWILPYINKFYYHMLFKHSFERVGRSDKIFSMSVPNHYSSEWAIPRDKVPLALFELKTWIEKNHPPAHFPLVVRFGAPDNTCLSAAYNRDVCYIQAIVVRPYNKLMPKEAYFSALEEIVLPLGGRPHWGKDFHSTPEKLKEVFPEWDQFCRMRRRLDPAGVFLNDYLYKIF